MQEYTLLPADIYLVVNKTILTDYDRKILISFYEPIIGPVSTSLYLTLWQDLETLEIISRKLNHHHLMSILKCNLNDVKSARESLESMGLLKSFVKCGSVNEYVYELYSPLSPNEFLKHPILNVVLYNNIGKEEYERLQLIHKRPSVDVKEFSEITKKLDEVYNVAKFSDGEYSQKKNNAIQVNEKIDFELLISSIPKGVINDKAFNKKTRELINLLAFIYDIDTLKMSGIIRTVLNEFNMIDKEALRKATRKMYQINNNSLPIIVYRTQPEYLKSPEGDSSKKGRVIAMFDNITPYDFLKSKNKGIKPSARDLKILELLLIEMEMPPAVVNVLLDYVLRKNNNRLVSAYIETIAGQWKRADLKTAKDAMEFAEKEHKSYQKNVSVKKDVKKPVWFNDTIEKKDVTKEEEEELKELLKEFN
ncbi:MAG: DnaD domain protein [bacterium]